MRVARSLAGPNLCGGRARATFLIRSAYDLSGCTALFAGTMEPYRSRARCGQMKGDADRYRAQAALCLKAASVTIAPGLAAEFDRLAKRWLKMADELERSTESDTKTVRRNWKRPC